MKSNTTNTISRDAKPAPRKNGRPPFEPSPAEREKVYRLARFGIPHLQIAAVLGISDKTLQKYFQLELEGAVTGVNLQVLQALLKLAKSGRHAAAAIFWAKVHCGLSMPSPSFQQTGHGDPNGER